VWNFNIRDIQLDLIITPPVNEMTVMEAFETQHPSYFINLSEDNYTDFGIRVNDGSRYSYWILIMDDTNDYAILEDGASGINTIVETKYYKCVGETTITNEEYILENHMFGNLGKLVNKNSKSYIEILDLGKRRRNHHASKRTYL